jgi:hypothetical protein
LRTEFRVQLYLHHYGFTPARVSELMAWPFSDVVQIKCGRPPKGYKVDKAPRVLKPRCKPKHKRAAIQLLREGKTPEEASRLANVSISTVREAQRKLQNSLSKGTLP